MGFISICFFLVIIKEKSIVFVRRQWSYFHWRFYFFNLFSFLPKLSQTFLYLEVEKAADQKFESKSRISTLKIK